MRLAELGLDWVSKANLDGLWAGIVKIVRRLILKIFPISEWKETGKLLDTVGAEKIKNNSIRDMDWVCVCGFLQFLGAPPRKV